MNILHTVESYDPASHGMQQVVKQLSERLFNAGHDVTVATRYDIARNSLIINGVKIEQFNISGNDVKGYNADESEVQRYRDFLLYSDFDIITNFAAQQWATDIALPILPLIKAKKVFVPTGFSEIKNPKFNRYFESMKKWIKEYDMNVFLSNDYQDINFARDNGVEKLLLIPNAASSQEFIDNQFIDIRKQLNIPRHHFLILHVGSHTGLKGHNEALKIFKKARIKNATFLLIGNSINTDSSVKDVFKIILKYVANMFSIFSGKHFFSACFFLCNFNSFLFKLSIKNVFQRKLFLVRNLTRLETVAAYKAADLFLFPSNIECSPLVLFESMAAKTPFLTTDVGNTKEIIKWSNSGLLLPTKKNKDGFSKAIIDQSTSLLESLISDKNLLEKMKNNGFVAFERDFNWEKISVDYEKLYYSLIQ